MCAGWVLPLAADAEFTSNDNIGRGRGLGGHEAHPFAACKALSTPTIPPHLPCCAARIASSGLQQQSVFHHGMSLSILAPCFSFAAAL